MNATKRKFNALLQGLSNPRPSSEENAPSDMFGSRAVSNKTVDYEALLQKRRRLGFPDSTAPRPDSSTSLRLSNLTSSIKRTTPSSAAKIRKDAPARYSPSDRDELLKRLATFQEITDWTPKPERINEVEWAKRGWVCQGKERVRCLLCHKELVVKTKREADGKDGDASATTEIEEALVDKYAELIVASHQSDCLWRRRGCDDTLLRLSFASTKSAVAALKERYQELCSRQSFLPYEFNLRLPDDMNLEETLSQLPSDFFTNETSAVTTPNRPALALALFGWQGLTNPRIGAVPNSASCYTCQRRLGLWMFKSKEVDASGQVLVPAPMDHLDPVREHRFFCPWKSATAQSRGNAREGDASAPAWKVLQQSIKNESALQKMYEGRGNKTPSKQIPAAAAATPSTPLATSTRQNVQPSIGHTPQHSADFSVTDEDDGVREAKDKERWARLRKVKSLFDTKKLRRSMSRPGTPQSVRSSKSIRGE